MAVSNSTDFSVTGASLLNAAWRIATASSFDETPDGAESSAMLQTLEMMLKAWQNKGVGLWKNSEIAVFQSKNGYTYNIGPSGDNATTSYVKTEIATAAASGAGSIVVDSITGITNGDYVGIELDDGTLQWTTVNGVPAAATITLTAVLTAATAVNNHVYTYTTKSPRPLEILEAQLSGDTDTQLTIESLAGYKNIANKTSTGTPSTVYFDRQRAHTTIKVWPAGDDVKDVILLTARIPIMDLDSVANDFDLPPEWFEPIKYNLAVRHCIEIGRAIPQDLGFLATESFFDAFGFDVEDASINFKFGG